ncbi:MAG TPA: hypothetical protein VF292_00980 [Rhodanobacteraceae bacterium]
MADDSARPELKRGLIAELGRRHVWRAAVLYIGAAWALAQGIAQLSGPFGLANRVTVWFVIACAIGFPFWIAFAWLFAWTPQGFKREEEVERTPSLTKATGRKLDFAIIGVLIVAVVLLASGYFVKRRAPAQAATAIPAKSIAVLPFENLSSDKGNAYFVAGMQDLILTKLADIGSLKVIARSSTQQYGSHPQNLTEVGRQLGVATLLEGSVQKAGDQVLINVQLIDARTDAHIWAKAYTRTLTNVFGVEGEVATQIATSLNAKLSPAQSAELAAVPTHNRAAYDAFLRAEYLVNRGNSNYETGDFSGFKTAITLYRQAVRADPKFALAWARLSTTESELAWFGGVGEDIVHLNAHASGDAAQAVKLAPDLAAAQIARGYVAYYGETDYPAALAAFAAALKLKPNDADAWAAQGFIQRRQGRVNAAVASLNHAISLDPRNSALAYELGSTYMQVSRFPEAGRAFQRALAIDPHNLNAQAVYPVEILLASGNVAKALAAAQGDSVVQKLIRVTLLTFQRRYAKALALLRTIPDTPDDFPAVVGRAKVQLQADLYALLGDSAKARALYAQDLPKAIAAIAPTQKKDYQGQEWSRVADDELGLGHTMQGLADIAKAQALVDQDKAGAVDIDPGASEANASLYAKARRPDLAVPLLTKALAMPGIGLSYSPALLRLDPAWDPIRQSPQFQALVKKYAKYKPAVIPAASAASTSAAEAPTS